MFNNLLGNLGKAQEKMKEIKDRLETIEVTGEVENVKVIANGNKVIKNIIINDAMMSASQKEELEELLVVAINRSLKNAENVYDAEMKSMAKELMPSMPGMF
ncbi:MAG: nucleoid-associated protein, YbaB/EbfC family [Bacteroidetes bacterium GWE2_29_8]|nr:MAG: nucleoid-associated protein, YbaB/EbfC family [Bacteroidetes bacterium GWE2_29_8]OFY16612.1 MAG: nucleoid-associated protein, YbaB/EbfC family [Bacteroidetes bacterium GWF2_29_10]